jgi:hypothetical protein
MRGAAPRWEPASTMRDSIAAMASPPLMSMGGGTSGVVVGVYDEVKLQCIRNVGAARGEVSRGPG